MSNANNNHENGSSTQSFFRRNTVHPSNQAVPDTHSHRAVVLNRDGRRVCASWHVCDSVLNDGPPEGWETVLCVTPSPVKSDSFNAQPEAPASLVVATGEPADQPAVGARLGVKRGIYVDPSLPVPNVSSRPSTQSSSNGSSTRFPVNPPSMATLTRIPK